VGQCLKHFTPCALPFHSPLPFHRPIIPFNPQSPNPHPLHATQSEANALEVELLEELLRGALPQTAAIYGVSRRDDDIASEGDQGESSEGSDAGSGDDAGSEDEGAAAARAARRHGREAHHRHQHQRGWSKGAIFLVLMLMVVLGQYVGMLLHLFG
jgi:hypothetical protein